MNYPVIYILTNKENGHRYVGQTRRSFQGRLRGHFTADSCIGRALRKHGTDGFSIQQIAYAREELNHWERYFIGRLNTVAPNGYNLDSGGSSDKEVSEETKAKLRESSRGHIVSDEARIRLSEERFGVPRTEEVKQSMRKPRSEEGRLSLLKSNNDPERLRKASERFKKDNPSQRPEVAAKISIKAKERSSKGEGNTNYFKEHSFSGEKNYQWKGPDLVIICANPNCRKEIVIRPGQVKKYCNQACMGSCPDRTRKIIEAQKGRSFTEEHRLNIRIAQNKRRELERMIPMD